MPFGRDKKGTGKYKESAGQKIGYPPYRADPDDKTEKEKTAPVRAVFLYECLSHDG